MTLTFRKPEDVMNAFAAGHVSREEMEFILNAPCFGLDRFEYIDCLNAADDLRARLEANDPHCDRIADKESRQQPHCYAEHSRGWGGRL